jgi:hypothetical protein
VVLYRSFSPMFETLFKISETCLGESGCELGTSGVSIGVNIANSSSWIEDLCDENAFSDTNWGKVVVSGSHNLINGLVANSDSFELESRMSLSIFKSN